MRSEIAARAVDNREFRSRVRHFMVRNATITLDETKRLNRRIAEGEEIPEPEQAEARRIETLSRQILANPDQFVVPLCIAICGSDDSPNQWSVC